MTNWKKKAGELCCEKYVLRKRPDRRNNPKHRANSIHAGLDDNIDLRTIKKNGEIDHDAIVDVLRNLITINPDFERDLREAYQMCGKLVKVA